MTMPMFEYKATTPEGKVFEGQREETDHSAMINWFQAFTQERQILIQVNF